MATARRSSTSRDPEEWATATAAARAQRELAAAEVAAVIADQAYDLIVAGDLMGGRAMFARRVEQLVTAERVGDPVALRSALMDSIAAAGAWVAGLDFESPRRG